MLQAGTTVIITARNKPEDENEKLHFISADLSTSWGTAKVLSAAANFDNEKYADCFSETAIVLDEGETHSGGEAIRNWHAATNKKYSAIPEPIAYDVEGDSAIMTTKVSGNFDGSPIILKYHSVFKKEKIDHLKITG